MKSMMLAVFVAVAVTAGIASAGIASLADAATVLINATSHSDPHANIANSLHGCSGQAKAPRPALSNQRRFQSWPVRTGT